MKHNKHPKKLNFNRVQMWWSPRKELDETGAIRIFYPNGKSEWLRSYFLSDQDNFFRRWQKPCCYGKESSSLKETYRAMIKYDKLHKLEPAEFLGYLS